MTTCRRAYTQSILYIDQGCGREQLAMPKFAVPRRPLMLRRPLRSPVGAPEPDREAPDLGSRHPTAKPRTRATHCPHWAPH